MPYPKNLLLIFLLCLLPKGAQGNNLLQSLYPRDTLEKYVTQPMLFRPVPTDTKFWDATIGEQMRQGYINNGKLYLGKTWNPIPLSVFGEYSQNGNRSNYEAAAFKYRQQLACLVMAELMQDSAVFIPDIIQGLYYFKQEVWWGVPAHYPKAKPDPTIQEVDLFNAETANLLAWTCYLLGERIERYDKTICEDIRQEINRRVLVPARENDYDWKRRSWNHNSWTCANWVSCILFCDDNRQEQIDDLCQVLKCLDIFIDGYHDDGGCDEGAYYWDRATGSLSDCFLLLSLASGGRITLPPTKKIKAMASYIYNMYIGQNQYVNYADCPQKFVPAAGVLFPLGVALGDTTLMQHAAFIAKQQDFSHHPEKLFNSTTNFPSLSREMIFLAMQPRFVKTIPLEAQVQQAWLPETEVLTAHTDGGLFLSAKGGHNDESHNHNDIGNFIVYAHNQPVIIDLGFDSYTAKTFSLERFTLMNTRAAYHNVPLINGYEQQAGRAFASRDISCNGPENLLSLDIAEAYPDEAGVREWTRSFFVQGNKVKIIENYRLRKLRQPAEITLMLKNRPRIADGGRIFIDTPKGRCFIEYNPRQVTPSVEPIDLSKSYMRTAWGNTVYRLRLQVLSRKKRGTIDYTIGMMHNDRTSE